MKRSLRLLQLVAGLLLVVSAIAQTEQHRATRLGNPGTRFTPPLRTPEDLRALFGDPKLKSDIGSVLGQARWTGDVQDLHRAALTAPITEWSIPVGSTLPFMASRHKGDPVCLRNVLWAGDAPAPAYEFQFSSKGRHYRCVTPKECGNFFVEDLGPVPLPAIALTCTSPAEAPLGRPFDICLELQNTGKAADPMTIITLALPPGIQVTAATEGGITTRDSVSWEIANLADGSTWKGCATLSGREVGPMAFPVTATPSLAKPAHTSCMTTVIGIPAILIETVDLEDPIEVGREVTYEIRVTNQGSAPGTHIRLLCTLPASQEFVSATGTTPAQAGDRSITMEPLPTLAPEAAASWRVVIRAVAQDDARFKVALSSDQFEEPITETEATRQY